MTAEQIAQAALDVADSAAKNAIDYPQHRHTYLAIAQAFRNFALEIRDASPSS